MRIVRKPPVSGGFGFPLGFLLTTTGTFVAVAAGATTHPLRAVVVLAAATAAVAALSTLPAALATAAVGWALHSGFVLGRHGDLVFTQQAVTAAIVLTAVAVSVAAGVAALTSGRAAATGRAARTLTRSTFGTS